MLKKFTTIMFFGTILVILSSCVGFGIATRGKDYFTGKSEEDLYEYFGTPVSTNEGGSAYDKIAFFSNRIVAYTATKQNVARYKSRNSRLVFRVFFADFNDGCLHWLGGIGTGGGSAKLHYQFESSVMVNGQYTPVYRHNNNDNAFVQSEVNKFKSEVQRLSAVASTDQDAAFQKTNIGSWYYAYKMDDRLQTGIGANGDPETFMWHDYSIYRVDVVADDRTETENYAVATYYENNDSFYANGNIISEEELETICGGYEEEGFTIQTSEEGLSLYAYIKDGKVIKVE